MIMAPQALLLTGKMVAQHWSSSPRRVDGGTDYPQPRFSMASVSRVYSLAHLTGLPDWLCVPRMSPDHGGDSYSMIQVILYSHWVLGALEEVADHSAL